MSDPYTRIADMVIQHRRETETARFEPPPDPGDVEIDPFAMGGYRAELRAPHVHAAARCSHHFHPETRRCACGATLVASEEFRPAAVFGRDAEIAAGAERRGQVLARVIGRLEADRVRHLSIQHASCLFAFKAEEEIAWVTFEQADLTELLSATIQLDSRDEAGAMAMLAEPDDRVILDTVEGEWRVTSVICEATRVLLRIVPRREFEARSDRQRLTHVSEILRGGVTDLR